MFSRLASCALLLMSGIAPTAAPGPMSRIADFSDSLNPVTVRHDGAEVTLRPSRDKQNRDWVDVSSSIRLTGYPTLSLDEGAATHRYYPRWVGIGRLSASDSAPVILLSGFSGGAHCCATLVVVVPHEGQLRALEFEAIDGEPDGAFPSDIDQDGVIDFVRQDDSFRYAFAGGAGSWSPPVVYNIIGGQIVDVSARPAFRGLWEDYAHDAHARCADQAIDDRNGACAAYVAAATRLGRYSEAMREVETLARGGPDISLPVGCRVPLIDEECPAGNERSFGGFSEALAWFLQARGYVE
jgi:hypothetical protein